MGVRGVTVALVSGLTGCSFHTQNGVTGDDDAPGEAGVIIDAPPDRSFDAPTQCFGNGLGVNVCLEMPQNPQHFMGQDIVIDTETSDLCVAATPTTFCVVAGTSIKIDNRVGATGKRPLVFVSTSTIELDNGMIDVASRANPSNDQQHTGPGADQGTCITGGLPDEAHGGGGQGGSLTSAGGNGGSGANGSGGIAGAAANITAFRGGCPGGRGGGGGNEGPPGHGGGAVYLFASNSITVVGTIDASGGGGGGANAGQDGGGGGGSGGLIVFDTPSLSVSSGRIYANGGGGASGSSVAVSGGSGGDPMSAGMAASGGVHLPVGSQAGTGGIGSVGTGSGGPGNSGGGGDGGGGAGGGGGAIFVYGTGVANGGQVSPPMKVGP